MKKMVKKAAIVQSIFIMTLIYIAPAPLLYAVETTHPDIKDNDSGMEFVFVKGGCFIMGDILGDGWEREKPTHKVCLDDYYIGKYEVTQQQYKKITGDNPSDNSSFFKNTDNYPVIQISWDDTRTFIEQLSAKSKNSYRLPTEAEWEYAARSGGKKEKYSGSEEVDGVSWYKNNSDESYDPKEWENSEKSYFDSEEYIDNYEDSLIHPVGMKKPNGLGIFDMSGNVYEWCSDWYDNKYYEKSPVNNPKGPEEEGIEKVIRGGSWYSESWNSRTTYRMRQEPLFRNFTTGFRLILIPANK